MKENETSINWDEPVIKRWAEQVSFETKEIERMRSCGCHQCLMAANSIEWQHSIEAARILNPPEPDHETQWEIDQMWRLVDDNNYLPNPFLDDEYDWGDLDE